MKFSLTVILLFAFNAHATLGERTSDVGKDLGCYSVKEITRDGIGIKEYINKSTNTVFMVRTNSRVMMAIQPLMKAEDFEEYKQAKSSRIVHHSNRKHKNASTETSRLKVVIDDFSTVHRSLMILKPHVPNCVPKPEALP